MARELNTNKKAGRNPGLLLYTHQKIRRYIQRLAKGVERFNGKLPAAALNMADERSANPYPFGQPFLSNPQNVPPDPHPLAQLHIVHCNHLRAYYATHFHCCVNFDKIRCLTRKYAF